LCKTALSLLFTGSKAFLLYQFFKEEAMEEKKSSTKLLDQNQHKTQYKSFVELSLKYKTELDKFADNLTKFSEDELSYANVCIDCVKDSIIIFNQKITKLFKDRGLI
jgi:hypothetical protein